MKASSALIISSTFAPVNASSIHRTAAVCRHLAEAGWKLHVLTMPVTNDTKTDSELLQRIPDTVEIFHRKPWSIRKKPQSTGKQSCIRERKNHPEKKTFFGKFIYHFRQWVSWWLQIPDRQSGWAIPAGLEAMKLIRRYNPDVIYSTAPAWTAHLAGLLASIFSGKPLLADFRDPWVANPFRKYVYKTHKRADRLLEKAVVRKAYRVICNTDAMRMDFISRYPLLAEKFLVINNGFDPEIIQKVRDEISTKKNDKCVFIHAGNFYGSRSPIPLFRAIKLASQHKDVKDFMIWYHAGPTDYDQTKLEEIIRLEQVQEHVNLLGKLPHIEVLKEIRKSDVAVAVGVNGAGGDMQIPRKFFEYIALEKPVLITGQTCGAISALPAMDKAAGLFLCPNGINSTAETIVNIVRLWKDGKLSASIPNLERFSETRMAERIEAVFQSALKCKRKKQKCLICVPSR